MNNLGNITIKKNTRYFFLHLYIYIGINFLFIIINLFVGSSAFTWIAFIWGIGIVFHGIFIFIRRNIAINKLLELEIKGFNYLSIIAEGKQRIKTKKKKVRRKVCEKEFIPKKELIPEGRLIEGAEIKLRGIRRWIYFNMIISAISFYIFLITWFFIAINVNGVLSSDFLLSTISYLFAFSSIIFLFILVLKGFELRQKFSLVLFKFLLTIPLLEILILTAVGVSDFSKPGSVSEILVYCIGIIPPSIIFIIRIIFIFYFWPRLRESIIIQFFNPRIKTKVPRYNFKIMMIFSIIVVLTLVLIFLFNFIFFVSYPTVSSPLIFIFHLFL